MAGAAGSDRSRDHGPTSRASVLGLVLQETSSWDPRAPGYVTNSAAFTQASGIPTSLGGFPKALTLGSEERSLTALSEENLKYQIRKEDYKQSPFKAQRQATSYYYFKRSYHYRKRTKQRLNQGGSVVSTSAFSWVPDPWEQACIRLLAEPGVTSSLSLAPSPPILPSL